MRTEQRTIYIANDGSEHFSEKDAEKRNKTSKSHLLLNMTEDHLEAARNREDVELADAIEAEGLQMRARRLAAGEHKRGGGGGRRQAATAEAQAAE
jgi:hypothetical protein